MLKRIIIFLFFLCGSIFAKDFDFFVKKTPGFTTITHSISENLYLYQDSISVLLDGENITNSLELKKPQEYKEYKVYFDSIDFILPDFLLKNKNYIDIFYQGCTTDGLCYPPYKTRFEIKNLSLKLVYKNQNANKPSKNDDDGYFGGGFFVSVFGFFISGVLLSLTPCVLPMMPILSSIIMAKSSSRFLASIIYVFGMSITYSLAGILAALFGQNLNVIFQNAFVLILFSILFVVLACSSFGFFTIQMPLFIQNKLNAKTSSFVGNLGVFFMGVLSALIVGPCVAAPLAGALLYIANTHDVFLGGISLFMLSVGMGLPLLLIGFGFGFIKSGGLMVNRFFGFVLLGVANYFLARVFDSDIYIYISYALLGFIFAFAMFSYQKDIVSRVFCFLSFVIVGVSSVFLYKAYEIYTQVELSHQNLDFTQINDMDSFDKYIKNHKKVMVYFTASWCENCKELKATTFQNHEVIQALSTYHKIKIDVSDNDEFSKDILSRFSLFGPPAMLFFDDGKLILKKIGYKTPKELLQDL